MLPTPRALSMLALMALSSFTAERYTGPRPPKTDIPYLMHADNLLEPEKGVAKTDTRKDSTFAVLTGANSPVKTPLAEPIFIIQTEKLQAEKFELYRVTAKGGNREVLINHKNPKHLARPVHLAITRLDERLYRIEIDEPLEIGEYTLTPQGSDDTFSFAIY
ncbi:MAG TPA: hypothetical protein VES20_21550 [Bryobacteraceae bacterium]|nr:hypothetical protein [Bryobacteraceae bacterium]